MGNQDRPPPDVERLEPRLTLSTIRPLRQRAGVAGPHASHAGFAAETREAPPATVEARSFEGGADPPAPDPVPHARGALHGGGFDGPEDPGSSGHEASGLHGGTSAQVGLIAFAGDHDPGHFVLVPTSQVNSVPYPSTPAAGTSHDGAAMDMGPGMSSRVAVNMPMHHEARATPRMTPTRDARPDVAHVNLEPGRMEEFDEPRSPHGHDLDPGLEPDLSPAGDPDLAPPMVLNDAAGVDADAAATPAIGASRDGIRPADLAPPDREADAPGPRLAALAGVAALFRRNLTLGRLVPDDPPERPAEPPANVVARCRALARGLYRTFRRWVRARAIRRVAQASGGRQPPVSRGLSSETGG